MRPGPLITDRAVLNASIVMLQALLEPLRGLIAGIESFDRQIAASYEQHPDKEVFSSLPGAGPVLAPRLLAAFGADRERDQSAEEIQCFSGIAPVIEPQRQDQICPPPSGVPRCSSARVSTNSPRVRSPLSRWARAYYDQQRRRGNKHHEAVRALAYKWARIIYRCWQDHEPYDEAVYIAKLELRGSPLPQAHPGRSRVMGAAFDPWGNSKSCSELPRRKFSEG